MGRRMNTLDRIIMKSGSRMSTRASFTVALTASTRASIAVGSASEEGIRLTRRRDGGFSAPLGRTSRTARGSSGRTR